MLTDFQNSFITESANYCTLGMKAANDTRLLR